MVLTIQFAHVAVILLPCFCLIYAASNSNEKQVSDINPYSSSSLPRKNVQKLKISLLIKIPNYILFHFRQ